MSYEENEKRVLTLIDDALNCENNVSEPFDDDADSDEEDGEVEVFDVNTDTEQEGDVSDDEQFEIPNKVPRVPSFKSKDGTVWKQHYPTKAVRTRQCNIVTHLPGVKPSAIERLKLLLNVGLYFLMMMIH